MKPKVKILEIQLILEYVELIKLSKNLLYEDIDKAFILEIEVLNEESKIYVGKINALSFLYSILHHIYLCGSDHRIELEIGDDAAIVGVADSLSSDLLIDFVLMGSAIASWKMSKSEYFLFLNSTAFDIELALNNNVDSIWKLIEDYPPFLG